MGAGASSRGLLSGLVVAVLTILILGGLIVAGIL